VSYRLLAVGTVAIYTAIGSRTVNVASAQQLPPSASKERGTPHALQFNIPPGTLDVVVPAFKNATQLHVQLPETMSGVSSLGVSRLFVPERALEQLLKGTGLSYRFTGDKTVTLELTRLSTSVDVTATADSLTASMPKYTEPLLDTPQTISVVPVEVIEEQNATTLRDTLRNVGGISLAAGKVGSRGDSLTIRGYTARTDLFIDGIRDYRNYYRDPFDTQEVEVLQGPSSVTLGRGSTGVVNQKTKTPQLKRFIAPSLARGIGTATGVTLG
jgi:catecholate siderophore receptor